MTNVELVVGIVGFVIVVGIVGVAWLTRGREPTYTDDSSILVPAPPPGMTAATATIIDGRPTHLAFVAALLDLASRDEIAFEAEGRAGHRMLVGIAMHGGESSDPVVRTNRRQPIGEGETWLLTQLRMSVLQADGQLRRSGSEERLPSPEVMQLGSRMMAAMLQAATSTGEDDDDAAARAAREHGLLHGPGGFDPEALARAYEARTGKQMPERSLAGLRQAASAMQVFSDPAAVARDPEAAARIIEDRMGQPMSPEHMAELKAWASSYESPTPAAGAPAAGAPAREYIPAWKALHLEAPFLFGTFVQSYATRHGWLAGLPLLKRLRWRFIAIVEVAAGLGLALLGRSPAASMLTGAGIGVAAGGVVTWIVAPAMSAKTHAGAVMKAQLAAYRRTLQMTFAEARSMDDAVGSPRLGWLETPDQALVWGIALGLRRDIEALFARTAEDLRRGAPTAGAVRQDGPAEDLRQGEPTAGAVRQGPLAEDLRRVHGRCRAQGPLAARPYAPAWYRLSSASGAADPTPPGDGPEPGLPESLVDPAAMFAGIEAIGSVREPSGGHR